MTESNLAMCEVVMWKRPVLALLLLGCGTLVWYYCGPLQRNVLSLVSDVLFTFVCSLGFLGVLCRHLRLTLLSNGEIERRELIEQGPSTVYEALLLTLKSLDEVSHPQRVFHVRSFTCIPVDPLEWQVSPDAANDVAACLANTVGAAEGVLRVAASGSDSKLFGKVVAVLYLISAIGRAASGATVAYIGPVHLMVFFGGSLAVLWFLFIVPLGLSRLAPEATSSTPTFLQKKFNFTGCSTPGSSPKSNLNGPQQIGLFS